MPGETEVLTPVRSAPDAIVVLRQQTPEGIQRFVDALLADKDMEATKAALAAGYQATQARMLLLDPRSQRLIAALTQELRETHADMRMQAISMLSAMASYDPADITDGNGQPIRNIRQIPPAARAAIKSIHEKADGSYKIEFFDRVRVIELLLKCFGDIDNAVTAPLTSTRVTFRGREKKDT